MSSEAGSRPAPRRRPPTSPARPAFSAQRFWATFGPGLLWAGTAIGVSHLVQSTRAGAIGGYSLGWVVLVALVLKYPFFEFGPRYAAATGESLVEGYRRLGRFAVWLYLLITLGTALFILSAIALFTAFVVNAALGLLWPLPLTAGLLLAGCAAILLIGRFRALDRTIKIVLLLLTVCTLTGALLTLPRGGGAALPPWPTAGTSDLVSFAFVLALVGWMPSAIDIAVWSSLWTLAKDRTSGVAPTVAEALLDFRIGYFGTGVIAFAFLSLGATVMHASGESFSPEGATFSLQLVDLYAQSLGAWSRPLITVAVVTTMFSTLLTALDGFPRAIDRTVRAIADGVDQPRGLEREGPAYWASLATLALLTLAVVTFFTGNLTTMVDAATIVSFLTAPVLGFLNLRVITSAHVPRESRPGAALLMLSSLGLALMAGTAIAFGISRF